jgi:hypothetical protein
MPEAATNNFNLLPEKPTIRILIYADAEIVDTEAEFGITILRELLSMNPPASANIRVDFISRVKDEAGSRLDVLLKDRTYSQVWFFGFSTLTREEKNEAGNPSKFSEAELNELSRWMETGGVLISGDHAVSNICFEEPVGKGDCPEELRRIPFVTLGRALGKQVPRAGRMREWEGPPTTAIDSSFNTSAPGCDNNFVAEGLEKDPMPQQLILVSFNEKGEESLDGQPHIIFKGRANGKECLIRVLPDHIHEGKVLLPSEKELESWPASETGHRPKPYTVAYGIDKRNGKREAVLAIYHGVEGQAGRIVADSSWHHFLNINLKGLKPGAPGGDSNIIDHLGQLFVNMAIWLAGSDILRKMAHYAFCTLARHPLVLEEIGGHPAKIEDEICNAGRVAHHLLTKAATPCEIHELLQVVVPSNIRQTTETLNFPASSLAASFLPSQQLLLGAIVYAYRQGLPQVIAATLSHENQVEGFEQLVGTGFLQAGQIHVKRLKSILSRAESLI